MQQNHSSNWQFASTRLIFSFRIWKLLGDVKSWSKKFCIRKTWGTFWKKMKMMMIMTMMMINKKYILLYTIDLTYTHDSMIKDKTCGLTSKNHGQSTCNYSLSLSTSVAALTGRRVANDQRPGLSVVKISVGYLKNIASELVEKKISKTPGICLSPIFRSEY